MRNPPSADRRLPPQPVRAATFRFGARQGLRPLCRLTQGANTAFALAVMRGRAANSDATTTTPIDARVRSGRTPDNRAGLNAPARRTAEKRPPRHGEMEHVHDIYGGIFADGTHPGSA